MTVPLCVPTRALVLLVDDDAATLTMLHHALGGEFRVASTTSGAEALAVVRERNPAVVIADLRMPTMNGEELIRRIKTSAAVPPAVVVLTGDTRPEHLLVAKAAGADAILLKPVDHDVLMGEIRSAVAERKP